MTETGADFWTAEQIARWREDRWAAQRAHLAARSAFYREFWQGVAPPERLDELARLPFTTKTMLRESQISCPPFGDYLAAPAERVARLHRTSGTTGRAMNIALSAADALQTAEIGARSHRASGLGPGHRVVHCLNYQMWMGGYTDHASLEATGATVIPFGIGGTELLVRTIREVGVTAIHCTPSYPAVLERVIAERFSDLSPRDLGLALALFGGEAGLDDPAFRARLESVWGFAARNANYGVSDVLSNFAGQCGHETDLHFLAPDVLYAELIEPESGAPLGWSDGATGELVLTHLDRECQPLVRFRTGDILIVTATAPCACGRTGPRFRVVGRSDDMVVVRGVNVFPNAVGAALGGFPELSGEYRIVLRGKGPYHRLPVEAELAEGQATTPELHEAVAAAINSEIRAGTELHLVAPLSLPRTEGKTRRVVREADD